MDEQVVPVSQMQVVSKVPQVQQLQPEKQVPKPEAKPEVKPVKEKSHPWLAITFILVLAIAVLSVINYTDNQEVLQMINNQTLEGNHSLSYGMGFSNGFYEGLLISNQTEIFTSGFNQCMNEINKAIEAGQLIVVEEE